MRAPGNENFEVGRVGFIFLICTVVFIVGLVAFKPTIKRKTTVTQAFENTSCTTSDHMI